MRLPVKEDFEKLCKCYTRFDEELKGRWFYDEETGEKLFLPCAGNRYDTTIYNAGLHGFYWSSTHNNRYYAYNLFFYDDSHVYPSHFSGRCLGFSVRLVSDESFEGAIHVAGLYWKPENEEGYYKYNEAIKKFNQK